MTKILTSPTVQQLLGAGAGMTIAVVVYLGVNQAQDMNIKGLLVSTKTVSTTNDIAINAKDVDPETVRRITARAAMVARTFNNSDTPTQAETPVTDFATNRRAARKFTAQLKDLSTGAKTYANDPNREMSEEDRLAIRAARIAGLPAPAVAPQPTTTSVAASPRVTSDLSAEVGTITHVTTTPVLHSGAPVQPSSYRTNLPNSGLGLNMLVLLTLLLTFIFSKTTWRQKLASIILGLPIG